MSQGWRIFCMYRAHSDDPQQLHRVSSRALMHAFSLYIGRYRHDQSSSSLVRESVGTGVLRCRVLIVLRGAVLQGARL